ncbi:protein LURP-one-related 12-like [Aristolochia californica]|uniref:protein LURP-one-related 12-like n=1 Tax=Aristolochia californica TaxID=171875 RepID=UPI0035DB2C6A
MSKIHPTENSCAVKSQVLESNKPLVLTVWKKSSMAFQGTDGFSVFDKDGRLAFRVDNYTRKTGGLVLMDGGGRALLTLKPRMLSMHDQWNGFEGDGYSKTCTKTPLFSMNKKSILQTSDEIEVFMGSCRNRTSSPDFRIDGCFRRRHCKIREGNGKVVAEICRKKVNTTILLSEDVFSLIVRPGFSSELIMAFIVVMDRICRKPVTPIMCS